MSTKLSSNVVVFKIHDRRLILVEQNSCIIGVIVKDHDSVCAIDICEHDQTWHKDIGDAYEQFNKEYTANPVA